MATSPIAAEMINEPATNAMAPKAKLLICIPSVTADGLQRVREYIAAALPQYTVLLASPGAAPETQNDITTLGYPALTRADGGWALTASDYLAASQLALEHRVMATLLLGAEPASLSATGIQALVDAVLKHQVDLALPRYTIGPHDALVSSALLYPLTRALFHADVHLPLPLDIAFSARMATRLANSARRPAPADGDEPLLWPVAEAALSSYGIREIQAGERTLPHPSSTDLNALLAQVAGSLFNDIELKASFWQRARPATPSRSSEDPSLPIATSEDLAEVSAMIDSFRNAYTNLQEIWSLVLPPQSLLGLKRVSRLPAEGFELPPDLWARTVYDFVLAFHARTINRGHLLGAFTPLYLAWVTSHLRRAGNDSVVAAAHVEEVASAFVTEKPYLVARWRWPDRFNP